MIKWRVQYEGERYNDFISNHLDILEMRYVITRMEGANAALMIGNQIFETYREYLREIESDD